MNETAVVSGRHGMSSRVIVWLPAFALGLTAFLLLGDRLLSSWRADLLAVDFRQTFLPAAEALLDGRSPYPDYGYPPLVAFLSVPFALSPSSEVLVTLALLACVPISLLLLDIRDPRCYAAAFLWVSVFNAVQSANVTLVILVTVAACWRWRELPNRAALAGGLSIALKIIAWPLLVWLAVTGRWLTAVRVVAVAVGVTLGLWATLGFSGLRGYPESLDRLQKDEGTNGYTIQALAGDLGLEGRVGTALAVLTALAALAGIILYARRGRDAHAFACALAAATVASPIIWLHSFALLLAVLAVLRPRFSAIWLLPAALWFVSPGTGNGETWQTAVTIGVAALVFCGALREDEPARQRSTARRPARLGDAT